MPRIAAGSEDRESVGLREKPQAKTFCEPRASVLLLCFQTIYFSFVLKQICQVTMFCISAHQMLFPFYMSATCVRVSFHVGCCCPKFLFSIGHSLVSFPVFILDLDPKKRTICTLSFDLSSLLVAPKIRN